MGNVSNLVWVLPRPRADHYPGGFPLNFERKLISFFPMGPGARILHPFGGMAEFGLRLDLDPSVKPDIIANAENLPFPDNVFDLVICDPPYTAALARKIYNSPGPKFKKWTAEATRVCKEFG